MRTVSLVLAVVAVACTQATEPAPQAIGIADTGLGANPDAGDTLPPVTLATLDGRGDIATSDLLGTPTVINFWATTCPFCVEEMPAFERAHQELGDLVRFLGVDRADDHDKARTMAEGTGVTYDLVVDPDESFFYATSTRNVMPTTLFVDEQGTIVHRYMGPLTEDELTALVEEHLLT